MVREDLSAAGGRLAGGEAIAAFPLPLFKFSDDAAFWKDVAWRAGCAAGACLVEGGGAPGPVP
jgi:hypothetical protein